MPVFRIDHRHEYSSPCRWPPRANRLVDERREWSSWCNCRAPRVVGLGVVCQPPPLRLGPATLHEFRSSVRYLSFDFLDFEPTVKPRPSRLSAVGVPAANETNLVSTSRERRQQVDWIEIAYRAVWRSVRRNSCLIPIVSTVSRSHDLIKEIVNLQTCSRRCLCFPLSSPQKSSKVASRDEIAFIRTPKIRSSIWWDTGDYCRGSVSESLNRVGLGPSWCISSIFLCPARHTVAIVTVFLPPPLPQLLPSHLSVPRPLP